MKYIRMFRRALLCVPCLLIFCGLAQVQVGLDALLGRLSEHTLDRRVLWDLEAHPPDARILPALRAAFEKRSDKEGKQWIAVSVLRLGERSNTYFDFLAAYATKAIDDRTPAFFRVDGQGHAVRGEFSVEFLSWCAANGEDPKLTAAKQLSEYPQDVSFLAEAEDARADGLFRRGLDSPNPGVVGYSVEGLGRLGDVSALPLIEGAAKHVAGGPLIIEMYLPWYNRPEAYALLQRLEPNPKTRDGLIRQVAIARENESRRVLSRTKGASRQ